MEDEQCGDHDHRDEESGTHGSIFRVAQALGNGIQKIQHPNDIEYPHQGNGGSPSAKQGENRQEGQQGGQ